MPLGSRSPVNMSPLFLCVDWFATLVRLAEHLMCLHFYAQDLGGHAGSLQILGEAEERGGGLESAAGR